MKTDFLIIHHHILFIFWDCFLLFCTQTNSPKVWNFSLLTISQGWQMTFGVGLGCLRLYIPDFFRAAQLEQKFGWKDWVSKQKWCNAAVIKLINSELTLYSRVQLQFVLTVFCSPVVSSWPPLSLSWQANRRVDDLYEDLRDGHNLISLLEVLSGERLVGIVAMP